MVTLNFTFCLFVGTLTITFDKEKCAAQVLIGAVFHHDGVPENSPLAVMGHFPYLMGRFPSLMGGPPQYRNNFRLE